MNYAFSADYDLIEWIDSKTPSNGVGFTPSYPLMTFASINKGLIRGVPDITLCDNVYL
jgi:hypothetical protein